METHLTGIYTKLEVRSKSELIRRAIEDYLEMHGPHDIELFRFVETAEEAWDLIAAREACAVTTRRSRGGYARR